MLWIGKQVFGHRKGNKCLMMGSGIGVWLCARNEVFGDRQGSRCLLIGWGTCVC